VPACVALPGRKVPTEDRLLFPGFSSEGLNAEATCAGSVIGAWQAKFRQT
jgi:hypothetical protein